MFAYPQWDTQYCTSFYYLCKEKEVLSPKQVCQPMFFFCLIIICPFYQHLIHPSSMA